MPQAFQQQATAEQPPAQHQQHAPAVQHSGSTQVVPQLWGGLAKQYGDRIAVHDPHQRPETRLTYRQGVVCQTSVYSGPVVVSPASSHGFPDKIPDKNLPPWQPGFTVPCSELHQQMLAFAAGLRSLGVQAGDRVSLFSENSSRWLVADQGIMFNGAADAVRPLAAACA
jgi:AMP-binding enzyme